MANSTSKKPTAKVAPKPKAEKPVEVKVEPVVEEVKVEEESKVEIPEEPVVEEEVKEEEELVTVEEVEVEKAPETTEIQDGDVYIHNILGTENSKWEVRRKTDRGYKVLGKYAYEKAKHYASQFGGAVREA